MRLSKSKLKSSAFTVNFSVLDREKEARDRLTLKLPLPNPTTIKPSGLSQSLCIASAWNADRQTETELSRNDHNETKLIRLKKSKAANSKDDETEIEW